MKFTFNFFNTYRIYNYYVFFIIILIIVIFSKIVHKFSQLKIVLNKRDFLQENKPLIKKLSSPYNKVFEILK